MFRRLKKNKNKNRDLKDYQIKIKIKNNKFCEKQRPSGLSNEMNHEADELALEELVCNRICELAEREEEEKLKK